MIQRRIDIAGIPENQSIQYETKRAQLILLSLTVTLPKFTSLAMKTLTRQPMAPFTPIQLRQNAAPIRRVIDESEQVERFWNTSKLSQCPTQDRMFTAALQGLYEFGSTQSSHFQRSSHS